MEFCPQVPRVVKPAFKNDGSQIQLIQPGNHTCNSFAFEEAKWPRMLISPWTSPRSKPKLGLVLKHDHFCIRIRRVANQSNIIHFPPKNTLYLRYYNFYNSRPLFPEETGRSRSPNSALTPKPARGTAWRPSSGSCSWRDGPCLSTWGASWRWSSPGPAIPHSRVPGSQNALRPANGARFCLAAYWGLWMGFWIFGTLCIFEQIIQNPSSRIFYHFLIRPSTYYPCPGNGDGGFWERWEWWLRLFRKRRWFRKWSRFILNEDGCNPTAKSRKDGIENRHLMVSMVDASSLSASSDDKYRPCRVFFNILFII